MNFSQWLISIGKSEKTAKNYAQAIDRSISLWAQDAGLLVGSLSDISSLKQFSSITASIQQLDIYKARNTKGKGMYSAALNHYADYLNDITGQKLADDIEQISNDKTIATTEKTTLINTRLGQGKYRQELINYWQGCAVTGFKDSRFLIASHIKPWKDASNQERLDHHNGLLLLPNLDKVFDLGYISFEESGKIRLSRCVEDYSLLGINPSMSVYIGEQHQGYMAYHREKVFIV